MTRMITITICLLFLAGCWTQPKFDNSVELASGITLTMEISPMFSLQSDWERRLILKTHQISVEEKLLGDTGWWRGSNLYLHKSGSFVLHEGQPGCWIFGLDPPTFSPQPRSRIDCQKQINLPPLTKFKNGYPASVYYTDLFFIGIFIETPHAKNQQPFSFINHASEAERELPNLL